MKKTRNEKNLERRELEAQAQAYILGGIRTEGMVDLTSCFADRVLMGALATLEESGQVQRAGDPDLKNQQPYRLAESEGQREAFRLARVMAEHQDWQKRGRQTL
jgi:hypothetical protein